MQGLGLLLIESVVMSPDVGSQLLRLCNANLGRLQFLAAVAVPPKQYLWYRECKPTKTAHEWSDGQMKLYIRCRSSFEGEFVALNDLVANSVSDAAMRLYDCCLTDDTASTSARSSLPIYTNINSEVSFGD